MPRRPRPPSTGPLSWPSLHVRLRGSHGLRSGLVIGVATVIFAATGYLFQTACIRFLGPDRFGDVAALLALTALIALPLGSVQSLVAREVAQLHAHGQTDRVRRLFRRAMAVAVPGSGLVLVLALALTVPIQRTLKIESVAVVVAGLSALAFLIVGAILFGFLQGAQRFRPMALIFTVSGAAKPVLVVPVLLGGLGAAGALSVNAGAALLTVVLASYWLRDLWRRGAPEVLAPRLAPREVTVLMIGSLAFASLTNVDVVLANLYLDGVSAGIYAAAALVGKFVLLLPAAVVTVLLPKAASRSASGVTNRRILLLSAAVTLGLALTAAAVLSVVPEGLLVWAFGPDFRDAASLLGLFGLAMAAAAVVNVYLFVYLAQRDVRFPLLVAAAAVAQVVVIALWHPEPRAIVLATLAACAAVMVVHEIAFPHALIRTWRPAISPAASPPPR